MKTRKDVADWLDANEAQFIQMADEIWANPERSWHEYKASKLQADYMEEADFDVKWDIGNITTAFVAEWKQGEGGPVIGFLGEYDALPGLSQKVESAQNPAVPDGAGHGCGHNLLGTGALAAAVALRNYLVHTGLPGTVRYYGCPAEEGGSGKVFMARDGVFDDVDASFNFHPGYVNMASKGSAIGVNHIHFEFHGRTAHAGASPHLGRSALDAVELMNVGVNYLREHVTDDVRLHYVITNGGQAPNIVPDFASVSYYVRGYLPQTVIDVTERVRKVAAGAAMMTETRMEMIFDSATTCLLNNHTLSDLQHETMQMIGPIEYTDEEMAFAAQINENMAPGTSDFVQDKMGVSDVDMQQPLLGQVREANDAGTVMTASTDVGDISWLSPLSMLRTTCWPNNVPGHSWGVTATGGMSIGHKGMMYAAKVMAASAAELVANPDLLKEVRNEFDTHLEKIPYNNPIPDEVQPPHNPHPLR